MSKCYGIFCRHSARIPLIRMTASKLEFMLAELNQTCKDCVTKKDMVDKIAEAQVNATHAWMDKEWIDKFVKESDEKKKGRFVRAFEKVRKWVSSAKQFFFNRTNSDTDGDGIQDKDEVDANKDGIPDELAHGFNSAFEEINADEDNEHKPSYGSADRDGDGTDDSDCDGDGVPDDIEEGLSTLHDIVNNVQEEDTQGNETYFSCLRVAFFA